MSNLLPWDGKQSEHSSHLERPTENIQKKQ